MNRTKNFFSIFSITSFISIRHYFLEKFEYYIIKEIETNNYKSLFLFISGFHVRNVSYISLFS